MLKPTQYTVYTDVFLFFYFFRHSQRRTSKKNNDLPSSQVILEIYNPSILLLGTALTFNPSAKDALCSLDSLREGESEYIRHQVNRILDLKPDIILCQAEGKRIKNKKYERIK